MNLIYMGMAYLQTFLSVKSTGFLEYAACTEAFFSVASAGSSCCVVSPARCEAAGWCQPCAEHTSCVRAVLGADAAHSVPSRESSVLFSLHTLCKDKVVSAVPLAAPSTSSVEDANHF